MSAVTEAGRVGTTVSDSQPSDDPGGDFAAFYRREFRDLVGLVYALTGSWSTAEDLAQETFVRAYRDWPRVGRYEHPEAWLRTVAANLATSRGRRLAVEARVLARLHNRRPPVHHDPLPGDAERFWAAVRRLPPRQAQAVALRYHGELRLAEIASAMGCAQGTVKAHLNGARGRLATMLQAGEDAGHE